MRYVDLITNNSTFFEAQLTPGQIKDIKLKINNYEEELRDLRDKKRNLDNKFLYGKFPPELKDKLDAYIIAYTNAIQDLEDQLRQKNDNTQFDKLMTGIKKNCGEIIKEYKRTNRVFYSSYSNDRSIASYSKPPNKLNLGDYRSRGKDIQYLIEHLYDEVSFDNAILATSSYSDITGEPYIIFPRDGFKFFYPNNRSTFSISDIRTSKLFDKSVVEERWNAIVSNPKTFAKFKEIAGDIDDVDYFMDIYNFDTQIAAIEKMVKGGDLPPDWAKMVDWRSWVTRESFNDYYQIKTAYIDESLYAGTDCIINTSGVYAIHRKFQSQVFNSLFGVGY